MVTETCTKLKIIIHTLGFLLPPPLNLAAATY